MIGCICETDHNAVATTVAVSLPFLGAAMVWLKLKVRSIFRKS